MEMNLGHITSKIQILCKSKNIGGCWLGFA